MSVKKKISLVLYREKLGVDFSSPERILAIAMYILPSFPPRPDMKFNVILVRNHVVKSCHCAQPCSRRTPWRHFPWTVGLFVLQIRWKKEKKPAAPKRMKTNPPGSASFSTRQLCWPCASTVERMHFTRGTKGISFIDISFIAGTWPEQWLMADQNLSICFNNSSKYKGCLHGAFFPPLKLGHSFTSPLKWNQWGARGVNKYFEWNPLPANSLEREKKISIQIPHSLH